MSARGSRPKISSESVTEPASAPSRVVIASFIGSSSLACSCGGSFWQAERAGLRRRFRQLLLDGVAHQDPAALGAGNGTLDQDQTTLDVGAHNLEVQGGDAIVAHMARHLLAGEGLAG